MTTQTASTEIEGLHPVIAQLVQKYAATANPGDVLRVTTCQNPAGWWTVLRNTRPIHHFPDKDDAEAFTYALANVDLPDPTPRPRKITGRSALRVDDVTRPA